MSIYDTLAVSAFNLTDLVQEIVTEFSEEAARKKIILTFEQIDQEQTSTISYYGNKSNLKTIFQQMIRHALSQTIEGYIVVKLVCQDDQFGFIIEDNGLGITSDEPITVTQRLYRGRMVRIQHVAGENSSLDRIKQYAKRQKGKFELVKNNDQGLTRRLWLPLQSAPNPI